LSTEFIGKVRFTHFDIDENPLIFTRYHIEAAPTLVFFKAGQEVERIIGPYPGRLKAQIERILAEVEK
jgi:thioredoxin-like negative regulator of GroEL